MPKLRVESFTISLDGFGAGPDQDVNNPLGVGGTSLHGWAVTTATPNEQGQIVRSHDLNRWLDEPGSDHFCLLLLEIFLLVAPAARGLGVSKPDDADDARHHCNGALPC